MNNHFPKRPPVYRDLKYLTPSKFLEVPDWVETLAINADGSLWGYETLKRHLEKNRFRHWSPNMNAQSIKIGTGYDIIGWEQSPISRS